MHIGNRLKELRLLRGLTQAKVSEGITSASHYSNIENGHFIPSQENLSLLAKRLSVPATYLTDSYIQDPKLEELLEQYDGLVEGRSLEEAQQFFDQHEKVFTYIPSLQQELFFFIIRCTHLIAIKEREQFKKLYITKVAPYTDTGMFGIMEERYNYISGMYYFTIQAFKKSVQFFNNALKLNDDSLLHARLTFNIALAYYYLHDFNEALKYIHQSKHHYLSLHDWERTAQCYNLIGVILTVQHEYDSAEEYIQKGLHITSQLLPEHQTKLLHNLADIYKRRGQLNDALRIIEESITLKNQHDPADSAISYNLKLFILLELKEFETIQKMIDTVRSICQTEWDQINFKSFEGKLALHQKKYKIYEKLMQQCIDFYFKHNYWSSLKELSEELAQHFAQQKRYKKAFELSQLCIIALKNIKGEM